MGVKKEASFPFTRDYKSACLPENTFLEKLIEQLGNNNFVCSQTKEKTGEAHTRGVGVTLHGDVGGGLAHSDIISNKWNPFSISCSSDKLKFLGCYRGTVKVNEMARYQKKDKKNLYDVRDYNISGNLHFATYGFLVFLVFCFGLYLSFKLSTGFWLGLCIVIALPSIFYSLSQTAGNNRIDAPLKKVDEALAQFERYIEKHNSETITDN